MVYFTIWDDPYRDETEREQWDAILAAGRKIMRDVYRVKTGPFPIEDGKPVDYDTYRSMSCRENRGKNSK